MGGIFSKPKMPEIQKAPELPDDKQLDAARRRRIAKETKSSGRSSTLLTTGGRETLGA